LKLNPALDPGFRRGDGGLGRFLRKSEYSRFVIPANAGIQLNQALDPGCCRGDGWFDVATNAMRGLQ
jgi:hypothetical protein